VCVEKPIAAPRNARMVNGGLNWELHRGVSAGKTPDTAIRQRSGTPPPDKRCGWY